MFYLKLRHGVGDLDFRLVQLIGHMTNPTNRSPILPKIEGEGGGVGGVPGVRDGQVNHDLSTLSDLNVHSGEKTAVYLV